MSGVTIGKGDYDGKGVYAARDFKKGEVVVPFNLKKLTQQEFDDLPDGEWQWTHCFDGGIHLFPEPERYVNHNDDPTTYPDHDKNGDVALRDIKKGEAVTIDNDVELQYELDTFLKAYEKAANSTDFDNVDPLIADDAVFVFTDGTHSGKQAVRKAFEDTWNKIQSEKYTITDVKWVAKNYWVASCTYTFRSEGIVNGKKQVYEGYGTNVLARIKGRWRVTHEHLSMEGKK